MKKPLSIALLARGLLKRIEREPTLQSLTFALEPSRREYFDAMIGDDCVLRVSPTIYGVAAQQSYSASLSLAYLSVESTFDELWSISSSDRTERYYPLSCDISDLIDFPRLGVPADDLNAVDSLAMVIVAAIHEHIWPMRTLEAAAKALTFEPDSPWQSGVAYDNWLPAVLLLQNDPHTAYTFALCRFSEMADANKLRIAAYRNLVEKLKDKTEQ